MRHIPSEPTLRQRMDEIGSGMQGVLRQINADLFKKFGVEPSALGNGYVPIDIDVSPFLDEKCKKEGISRTYKRKMAMRLSSHTSGPKDTSSHANCGRENSTVKKERRTSLSKY